MRKRILFLLFAFAGVITLSNAQNNTKETIYLKDGRIVRGTVFEYIPNETIKIELADGSIRAFNSDEVESILKETPSLRGMRAGQRHSFDYDDNYAEFHQPKTEYDITGYRGFVDYGYTIGVGSYQLGRWELTTSHGVQFNPFFFLGLGSGFQYYCTNGLSDLMIPLFLDFRSSFTKDKVSPIFGLKVGGAFYVSDEGSGLYVNPSIGVRCMVDEKRAINFTLGYTYQGLGVETHSSYYNYYSQTLDLNGFSIKAGFEF
jgi:hypothetical protein